MKIMKSGEKFLLHATAFTIGVLLSRKLSYKNLNIKNNNPTIVQYLNRLSEFFENNNLDKAEDEFLTLVDFGISPTSAFESVAGLIK